MPKIRFGIRSFLLIFVVVAVGLIGWLERRRYLREHVTIQVLDKSTRVPLQSFHVRTSIITKETGVKPQWSDWQMAKEGLLIIKVPAYCKLTVEAKAIGLPLGRSEELTTLIHPETSHNVSVSVVSGTRVTGLVVDDETGLPIEGAEVAPVARIGWAKDLDELSYTDAQGRFEFYSESIDKSSWYYVYHPKFNYHFSNMSATTARLSRANEFRGALLDKDTKIPIEDGMIEVLYNTENELRTSGYVRVRRTKTDNQGRFTLCIESDLKKTPIRFRKGGWDDVLLNASDLETGENAELQIEMSRAPVLFSGKAVDAENNPIRKFRIVFDRFHFSVAHAEKLLSTGEYQNDDGHFEFRANVVGPLENQPYRIEAENFAIYHGAFGQNQESRLNQYIVLSKGFQVHGKITSDSQRKYAPKVYLIDVRGCTNTSKVRDKLAAAVFNSEAPERKDALAEILPDGSFRFKHRVNGIYAMLVTYNEQWVSVRPVLVDSNDVTIEEITLPPTGSIRGVVKGWEETANSRWVNGSISPYEICQLTRSGMPSGKPFRVDHQGQVRLDDVLEGQGSLTQHIENNTQRIGNSKVRVVTGIDFGVRKDETFTFTNESIVLCELLFEIEPLYLNLDGRLSGLRKDRLWIERTEDAKGSLIWKVLCHSDLSSGNYTVLCNSGTNAFAIDVEYQRNKPAQRYSLKSRLVSVTAARTSSESKGLVHARFMRNKYCVAEAHIPPSQSDAGQIPSSLARLGPNIAHLPKTILTEGYGKVDIILTDPSNAWAYCKDVELKESIELDNFEWQPGGNIDVQLDWPKLNALPINAIARNVDTGQTAMLDQLNLPESEEKNVIRNLMPGRWEVELTAVDPIQGESTLSKKEISLQGTETVNVEFP